MDPPYREKNKSFFPKEFVTLPENNEYLSIRDDEKSEYFIKLTYANYLNEFKRNHRKFNIHSKTFQKFCLRVTNDMSGEEIRKLSMVGNNAQKRLVRTRVYAISTNESISWEGTELCETEMSRKREEMEEYFKSLKLYDWNFFGSDNSLPKPKYKDACSISVMRNDTQNVVEVLHEKYGEDQDVQKIAWLNLANAHHVCGAYSINIGGSQEEHVATSSNACALLGTCGEIRGSLSSVRNFFTGESVWYREGYHIPSGGSYFCKCKFLTGKKVDCFMVATAFLDLRTYIPFAIIHTEKSTYFDLFGRVRDAPRFHRRLKSDVEGAVKTAVYEGVDVFVAGASGCGAFKHDAALEAKIWSEVLEEYKFYFKEVVFAILDGENSRNVTCFKKQFPSK